MQTFWSTENHGGWWAWLDLKSIGFGFEADFKYGILTLCFGPFGAEFDWSNR